LTFKLYDYRKFDGPGYMLQSVRKLESYKLIDLVYEYPRRSDDAAR